MKSPAVAETIDEYIASSPAEVQAILKKIRATIRKAAPMAEERISYRIPAYRLNGELAYFAAFKQHIGFFPPVRGDRKLLADVARYAGEKGNLRFPLDEPIPYPLITRIVKHRVKWNEEAAKGKKASKVGKTSKQSKTSRPSKTSKQSEVSSASRR